MGAVIGHEITHGFDDQGRKMDGQGMLRDWWQKEDADKFKAQASMLGQQYAAIPLMGFGDLRINPDLTMGENIGDLGGIILALESYKLDKDTEPATILDGFTKEQRIFLGFGQVWRILAQPGYVQQAILTDPHSPGQVRAFAPLRNVDAWYEAFNIIPSDAFYIAPEQRVRIW